MSTVAQLIDRAYREFLYPADEQPTRFTLGGTITDSATEFTVDPDFLSPEEESLLAPGTVVELDSELVQIGAYDETSHVASSLKRAILGTTAAAHTAGVYGTISPEYPRRVVFDAICDEVVSLYPSLYAITTTTALALSSSSYTEVPATVMQPLYLHARPVGSSDGYNAYYNIDFRDHFPASTTGKAIIAPGFSGGGVGYLVHRAKFARPTSEGTDLVASTLLQEEWERIVVVGAVAHLIAGKDLSQRQQEFITQQLGAQAYPVLTPTRIRESLRKYRDDLLDEAKAALRSRNRGNVVRTTVI